MSTMHPPAQNGGAKRIKPKNLQDVLSKILQQLHRRDQYLFFAKPVSSQEVPNYYEVIKQPMDFGTIQMKLDAGSYTSLEDFENDVLLVTRNAQYFNTLDGPSAIVHVEAKKIEEWALKNIEKERPAIEEANAIAAAAAAQEAARLSRASSSSPKPRKDKRLNIKFKKNHLNRRQSSGTPRLSTPSRLQHEIKIGEDGLSVEGSGSSLQVKDEDDASMQYYDEAQSRNSNDEEDEDQDDEDDDEEEEEEDDDSDEGDDDDDDDDDMEGDFDQTADITGASQDFVKDKIRRRRKARKMLKAKTRQKRRAAHRQSSIIALLSLTDLKSKDDAGKKPPLAPVSTTSGAIVAQIPLVYEADGAVNLEALAEDERQALLKSSGVDPWPDTLRPFIQSIVPLHPDHLLVFDSLTRNIKEICDGLTVAIAPSPIPLAATHTYNVANPISPEHERLPFGISSGWTFGRRGQPNIPIAWPELEVSTTLEQREEQRENARVKEGDKDRTQDREEGANKSSARLPRRDRERERDEEGIITLDDWSWARPHLHRLHDALDFGLYPVLLPAAWTMHIQSQKGGPTRSRLPPYQFTSGMAFENALLDELASYPHRAFLNGKPGVVSMSAAQLSASPLDVVEAFEKAEERHWMPKLDDLKRMGARSCDVLREAVYGGPLGEAYASSVDDFIRGASEMAAKNFEEEQKCQSQLRDPVPEARQRQTTVSAIAQAANHQPSAYFNEDGELLDADEYIGVDLIPLEVRKESGAPSKPTLPATPSESTPTPSESLKRSHSPSHESRPRKRPALEQRATEVTDIATAEQRGMILRQTLYAHVRDNIIAPLTNGQLATLHELGKRIVGAKPKDAGEKQTSGPEVDEEQNRLRRAGRLADQFLNGEFYRMRHMSYELIRAQGNAVDMNELARSSMDMKATLALERRFDQPKQAAELPNPIVDYDAALKTYAIVLQKLAEAKAMLNASTDSGSPKSTPDIDKLLNQLRLAYIALGRRAPKLHQVGGAWTKWLDEAMRDAQKSA